jgi:hypothetical protein
MESSKVGLPRKCTAYVPSLSVLTVELQYVIMRSCASAPGGRSDSDPLVAEPYTDECSPFLQRR